MQSVGVPNQYCFWNALKKGISELGPSPWGPKMVYEHPQDVTCYHFGIVHYCWQNKILESPPRWTLRRIWKIASPHQSALALGNISRYVQKSQISKFSFVCAVMGISWKSKMLTDLDRTYSTSANEFTHLLIRRDSLGLYILRLIFSYHVWEEWA